MFAAFLEALSILFTWPILGFVILATFIGMFAGSVPGINGPIVLALMIPVTFGMDPLIAIPFLAAMLGGTSFGGSIPAILINTPGTAPNAATCFDGYPMAQQGRASEALGISAAASGLGAIFGFTLLLLILPVSREIILAFSAPELFWLTIVGLSVIAVASDTSFLRGMASGGLGLLISFVGYTTITGDYRYGFGTDYLWDGVPLLIALLGLFALAEIIRLMVKGGSIARGSSVEVSFSQVVVGVKHVVTSPFLFVRSSMIGSIVGMVPGAGGTVANFLAYLQAMQTSKDPDSFGTGNPDGVLASEASNDAKDGGQLLPMILFGIPGSAGTAVLLGGLILHGVAPGRYMLQEGLVLTFLMILALVFANIASSIVGILSASHLSRLTIIPVDYIIPGLLIVCFVGAYSLRMNFFDIVMLPVFGFLGYAMIVYGYSRIALILGLILGPIAEVSFHQSLMISDIGAWIFITRPISLVLLLVLIVTVGYSGYSKHKDKIRSYVVTT